MHRANENEIAARELVRAAFHEVSHAALTRYFGAYSEVSIWRNFGNEERYERAWLGQCSRMDLKRRLTDDNRQLIAMAGKIGEEIAMAKLDGEPARVCPTLLADDFFYSIDSGDLSDSDMRDISPDVTQSHVEQVVELLMQHWDEITHDANNLIDQAKQVSASGPICFWLTTDRGSFADFGIIPATDGVEVSDTFRGDHKA